MTKPPRLPKQKEEAILSTAAKKSRAVPTVDQDRAGYVSPYVRRQRQMAAEASRTLGQIETHAQVERARNESVAQRQVITPDSIQPNGLPQRARRNNNPGNLGYAGQPGANSSSGGFAVFDTPDQGFEAINRQIRLDKMRNLTLEEFVYKYAPPHENNTELYIEQLMGRLQGQRHQRIQMFDTSELAKFIAHKESGTVIK